MAGSVEAVERELFERAMEFGSPIAIGARTAGSKALPPAMDWRIVSLSEALQALRGSTVGWKIEATKHIPSRLRAAAGTQSLRQLDEVCWVAHSTPFGTSAVAFVAPAPESARRLLDCRSELENAALPGRPASALACRNSRL